MEWLHYGEQPMAPLRRTRNGSIVAAIDTFRPLPVHEHSEMLHDALMHAVNRVLIISPWITRAVVDEKFLRDLRDRLEEGVVVHIGYGIGQEPNRDGVAESSLVALSKRYTNFTFTYLGNTHAKILIKDSDWYVITSFNWLSFRGDPNRTFREEWGMFVSDNDLVESFHKEIVGRFNRAGTRTV